MPFADSVDIVRAAAGRAELVGLSAVDHAFTGAGCSAMTEAVVPWLANVFAADQVGAAG